MSINLPLRVRTGLASALAGYAAAESELLFTSDAHDLYVNLSGTKYLIGGGSLAGTYQPLDSDLTTIAALTTTAYGLDFLTLADAATARSYIGAGTGSGTVTSVDGSGGTTGLTLTGGPITSSGTLTLGGTLAVSSGGTGATTSSAARTNLGLGTAATHAATDFDTVGAAASAQSTAEAYSDAALAAMFPVTVPNGGTGRSSLTAHYLLVGNGTSAVTLLAPGTTGLPLVSQGASADQVYAVLGFAGGGTGGTATLGAGGICYSDGSKITAGSDFTRDSGSGHVGIGFAPTSAGLTVGGPSGGMSALFTDSVNSTLAVAHSSGSVVSVRGTAGSTLHLGSDDTDWVTVSLAGNVGIGTPSPASLLDLFGSATITFSGNSSTATKRTQFALTGSWSDSTDATRKGRAVWNVWDTSARAAIQLDTDGTYAQVGFPCGLTHGQLTSMCAQEQLLTVAASPFTDTSISIPEGSIIFAVTVRVTVAVPTATSFTVTAPALGYTFSPVGGVSTTSGTTDLGNACGAQPATTPLAIRITPNVSPANNSGRVRVTLHYLQITPPTS